MNLRDSQTSKLYPFYSAWLQMSHLDLVVSIAFLGFRERDEFDSKLVGDNRNSFKKLEKMFFTIKKIWHHMTSYDPFCCYFAIGIFDANPGVHALDDPVIEHDDNRTWW